MISSRIELLKKMLEENLIKLQKAINLLDKSYQSIIKINIKEEYSDDELEKFESLTSRFARATDILTQKVLKSYFRLIQEDFDSFIDLANLSEKFKIVEDADTLLIIRDLRNRIAHEYEEEELNSIFKEVINFTPVIIEISEKLDYIVKKACVD